MWRKRLLWKLSHLLPCTLYICIILWLFLWPKKPIELYKSKPVSSGTKTVLIYNRVPKTGSSTLLLLVQMLNGLNGPHGPHGPQAAQTVDYFHSKAMMQMRLNNSEQDKLAQEVLSLSSPAFYDRHFHFIDFGSVEIRKRDILNRDQLPVRPLYMNMVRDPAERFLSHYSFWRPKVRKKNWYIQVRMELMKTLRPKNITFQTWLKKDVNECVHDEEDDECQFREDGIYNDLAIPYMCGQDPGCEPFGSRWALSRAKRNVDQWYPVVGITEMLPETLAVLEKKLPEFFDGALEMFRLTNPTENVTPSKKVLSNSSRLRLEKALHHEYEFYHYLRQRLKRQLAELHIDAHSLG